MVKYAELQRASLPDGPPQGPFFLQSGSVRGDLQIGLSVLLSGANVETAGPISATFLSCCIFFETILP